MIYVKKAMVIYIWIGFVTLKIENLAIFDKRFSGIMGLFKLVKFMLSQIREIWRFFMSVLVVLWD